MPTNFLSSLTEDVASAGSSPAMIAVLVGTSLLMVLIGAMVVGRQRRRLRPMLFSFVVFVVLTVTWFATGTAIYTDALSYTGGPVRWQASYQIWACGNQLELRDPRGLLSGTIGRPDIYERNDSRIHIGGIPSSPAEASLGAFMNAVGGTISPLSLTVPLNDSSLYAVGQSPQNSDQIQPFLHTTASGNLATFTSGQQCGSQTAEVQVFVYKYNKDSRAYSQTRLSDPASYTISGERNVPKGDCIIMEFAPRHNRTDKICPEITEVSHD